MTLDCGIKQLDVADKTLSELAVSWKGVILYNCSCESFF